VQPSGHSHASSSEPKTLVQLNQLTFCSLRSFPKEHNTRQVVAVGYDPTQNQKTWRTAWRSLTKAAGLNGLRFHDLRHHSITKLAEAGVPDQTIMAIAGHVAPEMLNYYSQIRKRARQAAVSLIESYSPDQTPAEPKHIN
jgi:integrase